MKSFSFVPTVRFSTLVAILTGAILPLTAQEFDNTKNPTIKVDPAPVMPRPGIVTTFAPVVEKVAPSVVTVSTSKVMRGGNLQGNPLFNDPTFRRWFGLPDPGDQDDEPQPQQPTPRGQNKKGTPQPFGLGSGVIVSPEGHILTNNHVVEDADEITITIGNGKKEYKAKKIGTDPATDLAVLKIDAPGKLTPITFGDSDKLKVGDVSIAVGNPFGLTQTVTMGIISSLGRSGMQGVHLTEYEDFIQTDASINPGNSGGALVDTDGRLIGINTAIFSRSGGNQGIGFAVPSNLARSVMDSLIKNGRVVRGYLGIMLQPLNQELVEQFNIPTESGALVAEVSPGSPAEKGGIRNGDVVVEVNGKKVDGPRELQLLVGGISPGTRVNVKLYRDGKEENVGIDLGERPNKDGVIAKAQPEKSGPDPLDGVTVGDVDVEARKEFDLPEKIKGVVITNIDQDSACFAAGLRRGDIIQEINKEPITTAKQAVELSEKIKNERKALLRVSTRGSSRWVVVTAKD